mmetsp:Transcript_56556/g.100813  ORF Transcript_56556/g.100813 Transcript_56556/m.100813 type:complete len:90 (-) Transcript_56556:3239-3508(-)
MHWSNVQQYFTENHECTLINNCSWVQYPPTPTHLPTRPFTHAHARAYTHTLPSQPLDPVLVVLKKTHYSLKCINVKGQCTMSNLCTAGN